MYKLTTCSSMARELFAAGLSLCILLADWTPAWSCNIPVFRYALERWAADDYELIVYHEAALSENSQQLLQRIDNVINLQSTGLISSKNVNLRIVQVDMSTTSKTGRGDDDLSIYRQRWNESLKNKPGIEQPYAVLRTSRIAGQSIELWQGSLNEFQPESFLESPIRRELHRRLMRGDAIVWLVINSGQPSKNEAVSRILNAKNRQLSKSLELPEGIGLPGSELYSDVPLLLEFSILELDRGDTRESYLVELFSKLAPEAVTNDEPLIVPIFGRGRALEVIPGSQLDAGVVGDLAVFLSGACSCQVKERNPGFDLLLKVDWHKDLFGNGVSPPPPDEGLKKAMKTAPTLLQIPAGKKK